MKKSFPHILEYRREYARLREFGGSGGEINVRDAFFRCLGAYCRARDLVLVPELESGKGKRPDGTVRDKMRLSYGHWEAKGKKSDLDGEIAKKLAKGYPTGNILFENGDVAVLIQNDAEAGRADMSDDGQLDGIIRDFLSHRPSEIENFHKAIAQFGEDLPALLTALRDMIKNALRQNKNFAEKAGEFLEVCRHTINPEIAMADVREMLIQHVLTRDIFRRVFDEENFHLQNNIASYLEELQNSFMTAQVRHEMLKGIKHYYAAIARTAESVAGHHEKQNFLKALYENFYRTYNPKAADRLGVVYTPGEIVRYMVRAADELTHRWFGRRLYDRNVKILDPATGTGTFIAEMIDSFPEKNLAYKYQYDLYANEAGILPYYIANLNIEHAYMAKAREYKEFPGICFVDTLDNTDFEGSKGQGGFKGAWSKENIQRIELQNKQDISVIIGNPPYRANQKNENENNKNREYPEIDARIKETYIRSGTAQKTKAYDMYVRFIRWASDRLGDNGILAFVSNSSFIDGSSFDGFRKIVAAEFNELWILDMKGDIRGASDLPPEEREKQGGNIFGVRVGIAVWFFIKKKGRRGSDIFYYETPDGQSAEDKLMFLANAAPPSRDDFLHIVPDDGGNWVNLSQNNFMELLPLAAKAAKHASNGAPETVFKLFSLGAVTARDPWVYDRDAKNLSRKIRFLIDHYEAQRLKWENKKVVDAKALGVEIKWTRDLKKQLSQSSKIKYSDARIRPVMYRPFSGRLMYCDQSINEMLYQIPNIFPGGAAGENKMICVNINRGGFYLLAADKTADYHFTGDSQCLPLYRYVDGERVSNITACAVRKFRARYRDIKISAEDIFHYTYAVLHNPAYRAKYRRELMREFPRLPFYGNFPKWAAWGKKLMHLHINYAEVKPYKLARADDNTVKYPLPKLKADKSDDKIVVDTKTVLSGVPAAAWEYRLGKYSALEWVLDQYKEKGIRDATVAAKFNNYKFSDYKEEVIDLLARVAAVSAETVKIIKEMESENNG